MDGISNLVGGSDNLWKYLFTSGVILFALSIAYPLQQQQKLKLQVLEFRKEANVLEKKIEFLEQDVKKFSLSNNETVSKIDSLHNLHDKRNSVDNINLSELEASYIEKRLSIKSQKQEAEMLLVDLNSKEKYIIEFQNQSVEYQFYFRLSFWLGIVMGIVGLYNWLWSTFIIDCINKKQLSEEDKIFFEKYKINRIWPAIWSLVSNKKS